MADKIIVSNDIPDAMKAKVIVEEVLGMARLKYMLRGACRVISMDGLVGEIPIGTKLTGKEKVPAMTKADVSSQSYTQVNFDLWKNVVHLVISKEAELKSKQDLMRMNAEDAAKDLKRMEDKQIGEVLDTLTAVSGTDWSDSSNNPLVDIRGVVAVIEQAGYEADWILMNSQVYAALITNEFVVKGFERGALVNEKNVGSIAGLKLMVSNFITNKTAIVMASGAPVCVLGDGPALVESYHGDGAFLDGYAVAKFMEPKLVISDAGRKLTGLLP